jgi:uncharacterized protein
MTENELNQLETWLDTPLFKGEAMRIDKLQGFLCAVISSPEIIPPGEWMPEALGQAPEYESLEQATKFMSLLMGFYNDVTNALQANQPPKLILRPHSATDKRLDYQTWCEGYILGWALSTEEWLRPGNEPLKKLTFPILHLSGAFREEAQRRGEDYASDEENDSRVSRDCADMLPQAVAGIYNFWLSKKKAMPITRETKKIGRNELCPCGSGKKFKLCCAKDRTLH